MLKQRIQTFTQITHNLQQDFGAVINGHLEFGWQVKSFTTNVLPQTGADVTYIIVITVLFEKMEKPAPVQVH